jgi:hypothetical protein
MIQIKKKLKKALESKDEILIATYDGGNDSGAVILEEWIIKKGILTEDEEEELLSKIEDILDYGSWSWDGSANGEVFFTKKGYIKVEGSESYEEWKNVKKLEKL